MSDDPEWQVKGKNLEKDTFPQEEKLGRTGGEGGGGTTRESLRKAKHKVENTGR